MQQSLVAPELVWGLIPRFVGFVYVLAFGALIPQLEGMIGSRGLGPITPRLAQARVDFPGFRRFRIYPTLLWISSSDRTLRVVPWLGVLLGALCIYGGPAAPYAHFMAWLLWLSLEPAALIFPWDTMLMEAGFLVQFLPTAQPLPDLHASALPYPAVAMVFRFFVLRLMLGFGKIKFVGTKSDDMLYLRGFFGWSSTTPLAWYGHHLPAWMLRAMLAFMFVGEVIAPVLGFFTGPLRVVSFALLGFLMIGIQATGNWGYFNIAYLLLCVCLLDTSSSIFDLQHEPWHSTLWSWPHIGINAVMTVLFFTGLVYLIASDSWTMRTLLNWPLDRYTYNRRWLRALLAYFRALSPLRICNGYGVFPPGAAPPILQIPLFEGSDDGATWKAYSYRFAPSSAKDRSKFVAPYHPRMDMAAGYSSTCVFDASFFGAMVGDGTPYACWARSSWLERLCQKLLEGEPLAKRMFEHDPFPDAPPKWMRVTTMALVPSSPNVKRATGEWLHAQRLGVIIAPHQKRSWPCELGIPVAEVFHPDWVDYKRNAAPLKAMVQAFQSGMAAEQAILTASDLTADDVRRFWTELVPAANQLRGDFSQYHQQAEALEQRFGKLQLARFERVLERFAWLLRQRTERHQFADALPTLPIKSNFRYHLFLQELVMDGAEAYSAYLSDIHKVVARWQQSTDEQQLWTLALLRHELMIAHMAAFHWTPIGADLYKAQIPGIFEYHPVMTKYPLPSEEIKLVITKHPNGEHTVPGLYPPPQGVYEGTPELAE